MADNKIYDVAIIGAGVSGVGMACRLSQECPNKSYVVLERRERIGGTWDLMRYPGVRSDSDMYTFGYQFRPWRSYQTLADGTSIRNYLADTAKEYGVADHIEYGVHCQAASWDSKQQLWTITTTRQPQGTSETFQCRFMVSASGYYNYDHGHRPAFRGEEKFGGQIIHPQQWPQELDYSGKKVVVVGSGATAITLVPAMAKKAAKVTMLQRSPTYIYSLPGHDRMTELLDKALPKNITYAIARYRNLQMWQGVYKLCRRFPNAMHKFITGQSKRLLGNSFNSKDFTPHYKPWDERLCAVPDGDLYTAIKSGKAAIVTDHIDTFTAKGVRLKSGQELEADIIVSATGLAVQLFGGMAMQVDGNAYDASKAMAYKSVLMQDLPNYAWIFGYINLSWTMKADMSSLYLCRLFNHMDKHNIAVVTPRADDSVKLDTSVLSQLSSGYVKRAEHLLPRQGKKAPWIVLHNYKQDKQMMLKTPIDDPANLETQAPIAATTGKRGKRDAA